uniref:MULE transposase domain-containing protein n=1 Tax=Ditylenchus dipsaci TaxID=166011 RepID=A0A915DK47_9BILA
MNSEDETQCHFGIVNQCFRRNMRRRARYAAADGMKVINNPEIVFVAGETQEAALYDLRSAFELDVTVLGNRLTLVKQKLYPVGSTSPADLSIPDIWKNHVDGTPFNFINCPSIGADGTFFARPPGWGQLYAMHMRIAKAFIPAVVIFMERRTEEAYLEVFREIDRLAYHHFGQRWIIKEAMTDFEVAIRNAIRNEVDHRCCYFHYSYALTKRLKKLNLKKEVQ